MVHPLLSIYDEIALDIQNLTISPCSLSGICVDGTEDEGVLVGKVTA